MSILAVGSIALDTIETPAGRTEKALGGATIFFSIAASLFHRPIRIIGVVGKDFPSDVFERLAKRGIDSSGVERTNGDTFQWKGVYQGDMSVAETRDTHLGVFSRFSPRPETVGETDYCFLANIDPDLQGRVLDALEKTRRPRFVALDTMNFWIDSKRASLEKMFSRIDCLFVSEGEARSLTGESLLPAAARRLLEKGPKVVAIKKGPHGSIVTTGEMILQIPPVPLERIVDPTGAGDCYAGGFVGVLAEDGGNPFDADGLRKAAGYAAVVASFDCESFSTERLERVTREEVETRLSRLRESARF